MQSVTLEKDAGKFANLLSRAEVYDPAGRFLGYFLPSTGEGLEIEFTEEELEQARQDVEAGRIFSTRQVLDHLKNLECD